MQLPHSKQGENNEKEGPHNISTGASAGGGTQEQNFSEFMWMAYEDLDEFDRKVIQECDEHFQIDCEATLGEEEEEFLQRMLEEEEERDTVYFAPHPEAGRRYDSVRDLSERMQEMNMSGQIAVQSNLNPHAAEFIPGQSIINNSETIETGVVAGEPTIPTGIHQNNVTHSAEGTLYSSNCINNSIQALPPNNTSCVNTPNIVFSQNSSHQRFSNPVRAQLNGHNAMRRYYPNVNMPVYLSNVSVFPMMNGTPYVQTPPVPHQHPQNRFQNPDSDRNEDEGYGDN